MKVSQLRKSYQEYLENNMNTKVLGYKDFVEELVNDRLFALEYGDRDLSIEERLMISSLSDEDKKRMRGDIDSYTLLSVKNELIHHLNDINTPKRLVEVWINEETN